MTFSIEAKRLTDITQTTAFSTGYEIAAGVELDCPFATEWAEEEGSPSTPGEPSPLQENAIPFPIGLKFEADGVAIGFEAGEPGMVEFDGSNGDGSFAE